MMVEYSCASVVGSSVVTPSVVGVSEVSDVGVVGVSVVGVVGVETSVVDSTVESGSLVEVSSSVDRDDGVPSLSIWSVVSVVG